ncbi:MAG: hypothetical protein J3R72DRAFT_128633 [Linnemannia gamsii]|nr:MAG: hypothetical protein J3R72DRAFT_128633 [Linnemannia gamsii]
MYDRKSRHRRIKKQRRYERLAATSQLLYPYVNFMLPFSNSIPLHIRFLRLLFLNSTAHTILLSSSLSYTILMTSLRHALWSLTLYCDLTNLISLHILISTAHTILSSSSLLNSATHTIS